LPTDTSFHGIVPTKAEVPLGKVALDVIFGAPENFRREKIEFEVVDWPSQYHAILGRPAFARFMAVPHYTYLMMKMPGPNGVITVKGSFTRSDSCDREFNKISESFGMQAEFESLNITAGEEVWPEAKRAMPDSTLNSLENTEEIQGNRTDPNSVTCIAAITHAA